MDQNIKVAASYLHRAVSDMQSRINEIQQSEYREKRQESQEEDQIAKDLHQDEFDFAMEAANKDKDQREVAKDGDKIITHDRDLRNHRNEIKNELNQKASQ